MTSPGGRHRAGPEPAETAPVGAQSATVDRRPSSDGRLRAVTFVVVLLWLPAAAAIAVFLLRTPAKPHPATLTDSASSAASTAARTAVGHILSYDYRTIAANVATAKSDSTGVFASQYASTAPQLLSEAKTEKAIVSATIGSTGVVSSSSTNVIVLLFVDSASVREPQGQKQPTTRIDQSRVQVTMTLVNGHWLVSKLQGL